ncbi:D-aminoacyl-tRNA deacylase [Caviibacter abscessus]|uniref:D-aminoacyl-tRNA deacylase n=1 Tax=Caviibacter abscessus TaxID=1766719 RepID=UPI000829A990|nr:D-aminoacyl-tRNA deacylase [Caviibacter abscessus]
MRLLIQRVDYADILINNTEKRNIKKGLLVYVGVKKEESQDRVLKAVDKLLKLGFFENEEGKLKKSIVDISGDILVVPNFSLYATSKKGKTLSFDGSANFEYANKIYDEFIEKLKSQYKNIVTGEFKTQMDTISKSNGPVNVILDF